MLVSIIMPVYNCKKYVAKSIESFMKQELDNIELVIVDDGSNDGSLDICRKYQLLDKRIKIIQQENCGVSEARNTGLSHAVGKYIFFLDSDDQLSDNFSSIVLEAIKSDYDMYFFDYYIFKNEHCEVISRKTIGEKLLEGEAIESIFYCNTNNEVWCNLYKKEVIDKNHLSFPQNVKMGEDLLFNLSYARTIHSAVYIPQKPYIYNTANNTSAMHLIVIDYLNDYITIYEFIKKNYPDITSSVEILNKERYLNVVFRILLYSRYKKNEPIISRFLQSELFHDLVTSDYTRTILKIKKFLLKFKFYNYKYFMKLFKWTFYRE